MKIAVIVQRYGPDITGGSEHLCRMIAERLARKHDVEVLTTCARDYISWKNEYPEGRSSLNGVRIYRFKTERTRNLEEFNRFSDQLYQNNHTIEDELRWLDDQGPYSPSLIDFLKSMHRTYDRLLFFTYLYYPAYHGLQIAPEKSVLVPTAHDEPAIRLSLFRQVFSLPYALIFNTPAEKEFAQSLFQLQQVLRVGGVGVEIPAHINRKAFKRKQGLIEDYFYYGGRIDAGKGCAELVEFYQKKKHNLDDFPFLILSGHLSMNLPADPSIIYTGYLSEQEKSEALQGALAVVIPSVMESLSLLLLEGFAARTPVLVKEGSAVLKEHCIKSNAGLFYNDYYDFSACVDYLMRHHRVRHLFGLNGQRYVHRYYSWPRVLTVYEETLNLNANVNQHATF
ncbi:glycosyltransferase [bacterium]|nr:glycosyltransferase [bacterium]MCI0605776.1 glycosyltransferase [bacterium]